MYLNEHSVGFIVSDNNLLADAEEGLKKRKQNAQEYTGIPPAINICWRELGESLYYTFQ